MVPYCIDLIEYGAASRASTMMPLLSSNVPSVVAPTIVLLTYTNYMHSV